MNMSVLRRMATVVTVLALAFTLTACFETPDVIISNEQDPTTPTSVTPTTPTVAAKEGQLTLSLLMGIMHKSMTWSELNPYTHTAVDDTHATFAVADNYGKECTLNVTYDAATDTLSEATLSYGDVSVDVLSDNTLVIRTIMVAMNKE